MRVLVILVIKMKSLQANLQLSEVSTESDPSPTG